MDLDSDNPLALEIRQEMAAAYFAACKKMVAALEALKAFDRDVVSPALDPEKFTVRTKLLEDAAARVQFVVIQREAMSLHGYQEFFNDYEVPNEVRIRFEPPWPTK